MMGTGISISKVDRRTYEHCIDTDAQEHRVPGFDALPWKDGKSTAVGLTLGSSKWIASTQKRNTICWAQQ